MTEQILANIHLVLSLFFIFYLFYNIVSENTFGALDKLFIFFVMCLIYGTTIVNIVYNVNICYFDDNLYYSLLSFVTSITFYISSYFYIKKIIESKGNIIFAINSTVTFVLIFYIINNFELAKQIILYEATNYNLGYTTFIYIILPVFKWFLFPIFMFLMMFIKTYEINSGNLKKATILTVFILFIISVFMVIFRYNIYTDNNIIVQSIMTDFIVFIFLILSVFYKIEYLTMEIFEQDLKDKYILLIFNYRLFLILVLICTYTFYYISIPLSQEISTFINFILPFIIVSILNKTGLKQSWNKLQDEVLPKLPKL